MPIDPAASLVDALRQHRLLETAQLEDVTRTLLPRGTEPRALAKELLNRGWLTPFQVNQLLTGRGADLVLGSYTLLERLGEGGMGHVYKARHRGLGRIVALKVIRRDRLTNAEAVKRFQREIQAVAQLSHPNVVLAYDAAEAGGLCFFAMEYVEGIDLGKWVKEHGPLPIDRACEYVRRTALGLQHAFERGLVHRDIKPSNLIVTAEALKNGRGAEGPQVKLMDLGLARLHADDDEQQSALTMEGAVVGTPDFIAPEQARNARTADIRADLYSLGCTLYFLLTGQTPFVGGTLTEKLLKHHWDTAVPVEQLRRDTPPAVAAIVKKLMAKKPEDRYQTPADLANALTLVHAIPVARAVAVEVPTAAPSTHIAVMSQAHFATPVSHITQVNAAGRGVPWRLPPVPRRWLFGGATALLGLFIVWAAWPSRRAPKPDPQVRATQPTYPDVRPIDGLRRDAISLPDLSVAGNGDPKLAPAALVAILGDSRLKHWNEVTAVAFGNTGNLIASASADGTVRLWEGTAGQHVRTLAGHQGAVTALAYNADYSHLITLGSDRAVKTWDANHGKELASMTLPAGVTSAVLSGDGQRVAAAVNRDTIGLWDVATRSRVGDIRGQPSRPSCLTFSGDGQFLLAGFGDGGLKLFNLIKENEVELPALPGAVSLVALSADGKLAAAGCPRESTFKVYDTTAKGFDPRTLAVDGPSFPSAAFSPDGKTLAIGHGSGNVRLWGLADAPKAGFLLAGHLGPVTALAFSSRGGALATGARDGQVKRWDVTLGREAPATLAPAGGRTLAFSADGKLLAWGGRERVIHLHAIANARDLKTLPLPPGVIHSVAISPDGKHLAAAFGAGPLRVWELPSGRELLPLRGSDGVVNALAFSADGKALASVGSDRSVRLWDVPLAKEIKALPRPTEAILSCVAISGDGKNIAFGGSGGTLFWWDTARPTPRALTGHTGFVPALAFAPDGKSLISAGTDGTIRLWDAAAEGRILAEQTPANGLAFSPDGKTVAAATALGSILFLEPRPGGERQTLAIGPAHGHVLQLAYSPEGRFIATANGNGTAYILRLPARR